MSILHHPSEDILFGHATGRLGRGPALVVDAHLCACGACRAEVDRLEAVGGALLESTPPAGMSPDALAHAMARIERPAPSALARHLPAGVDLSAALDGVPLGARRWLAPGVWMRPVLGDQGGRAKTYLLRTGPGRRFPRHGHSGVEFVCVVRGGFSDEAGRYGPGDFAEADVSVVHTPAADPDGECICLFASEGPMRMRDLVGRLLQPFFGL